MKKARKFIIGLGLLLIIFSWPAVISAKPPIRRPQPQPSAQSQPKIAVNLPSKIRITDFPTGKLSQGADTAVKRLSLSGVNTRGVKELVLSDGKKILVYSFDKSGKQYLILAKDPKYPNIDGYEVIGELDLRPKTQTLSSKDLYRFSPEQVSEALRFEEGLLLRGASAQEVKTLKESGLVLSSQASRFSDVKQGVEISNQILARIDRVSIERLLEHHFSQGYRGGQNTVFISWTRDGRIALDFADDQGMGAFVLIGRFDSNRVSGNPRSKFREFEYDVPVGYSKDEVEMAIPKELYEELVATGKLPRAEEPSEYQLTWLKDNYPQYVIKK